MIRDSPSMIIFAPHAPYPGHLRTIIKKMRKLGPPKLHAYWHRKRKAWFALEGSHRTAAAKHLGLIPIIKQVYLRSKINHDTQAVLPDRKVSSLITYYDEAQWWTKYEF